MKLEEYIKLYNKSFEDIKTEYPEDFDQLFGEDRIWLGNIENKLHLLEDKESEEKFRIVIDKLKGNVDFSEADTELLSVFNAKIDKIVNIANFINNFKEHTPLEDNTLLKLFQLFNSIKSANSLAEFNFQLNSNLNNFLPHLFSIIKHCQNPNQYPVFYKLWRNIIREVLGKKDDYDNVCLFYREFPLENRHLYFGAYLGTISLQIAKNAKEYFSNITFESKDYKYLISNVINLKRYKKILDESMDLYQLKRNFLNEWPLSRIQTMELEEYTNLDKTSFCYWLEAKTNDLGSIWGGSSYKFGIYKRRDLDTPVAENCRTDGEYAWFQKYGETKDAAFESVKRIITEIINHSQNNELDKIDSIDLGDAYKWKIAFLYGDFNVVNIYKKESLIEAAQSLKHKDDSKAYSALNKYILSKKEQEQDYFEFTSALWKLTSLANPVRCWLYAPGENANKWEEFYQDGIMGLGWDNLGNLENYASKKEIKEKLQELYKVTTSKQNDTAANFDFHKVIKPGDIIIVKKGMRELLGYGIVSSDYNFDDNRKDYKSFRKVDWKKKGNWKVDFVLAQKTLTDITKYPTDDPAYSKYSDRLIGIMGGNPQNINSNTLTMNHKKSLNQILYGPPGTGKTYKLQQIIETWNLKEKSESEKDYTSFVKNISWWQSISLAILDLERVKVPELAKHPLIKAKLGSGNVKSLNTRLWSSLQHHCVDDCENVKLVKRIGVRVFYKEAEDSIWRLDNSDVFKTEYSALVEAYDEFKTSDKSKGKDYTFTTCHQSLSYEDFVEGIKPTLHDENEDEDEKNNSIIYEIRKGIFYNACEKAAQKAGFINLQDCLDKSKEERAQVFSKAILENKIHVVFLDEINRCNVSSVFGELITLIEEDKRLGKENEIADITLPYSQDEFGVPPNLYIIGTMNTADRSVEALDTALRRRFCFEEMPPIYNLKELEGLVYGYPLGEVLKTINKRIVRLLDDNHAIGHSYFLNKNDDTIIESFYKNIIPLLQEYFFGDFGKMMLVLGNGFVTYDEWKDDEKFFASCSDAKNDYDVKDFYSINDYTKDKVGFTEAFKKMMNK